MTLRPRHRRLPFVVAIASAVLVLSTACSAAPEVAETPWPEVEPNPVLEAAELSLYGGVAQTDFGSQCTATLIETGVDTAPAYMLTNGHCVGLDTASANQTVVDAEGMGEAAFFNVSGAAESDIVRVPAERVEYATMRARDIAVVRLASTLGELRAAGAVPLPINGAAATDGAEVVNIAVPTQNVDPDAWVLRKGGCVLSESFDVIEWRWLWTDAPVSHCASVLGGSSGSPLIADGEIVSIINTTTLGVNPASGGFCYLGKPCAVSAAGVNFVPGESYGVDVTGVENCFVAGVFTLDGGCPLEVTTLWEPLGGGVFGTDGTAGFGETPWLQLAADSDVRVRLTAPMPVENIALCDDATSYTGAEIDVVAGAEEPPQVPITLPSDDGYYVVCAAVPGQERLAARVLFTVDSVPAAKGPAFAVTEFGGGEFSIDPLFDMPEISDIKFLLGPADSTDCEDFEAYEQYRRIPVNVQSSDLPARFCAIGFDLAGNQSPASERLFEK